MTVAAEFFAEFWPVGLPDGFFVEFRDLSQSPPVSAFRDSDGLATLRDADSGFVAFSVAATNERRPVKEDTAKLAPAAWVDIDVVHRDDKATTDPVELQERLAPVVQALADLRQPPSAVIYSGGGLHLYWRLDRPTTDMQQLRQINEHLVGQLHGDKAAVNASRVMRMPGSVNDRLAQTVQAAPVAGFPQWRNDDYTLDELLQIDGAAVRAELEAIGAACAALPAQRVLDALDGAGPQLRDWQLAEQNIRAGVNWHTNVRDRVASMTQQGVAEADILDHALRNWTLPGYSADDTRQDVLPLIRTALQKWPLAQPAAAADEPAEQALTYETWRALWPFDQRANKFVDLAGDGSLLQHQAWELRNAPFADVEIDDSGKTKRVKWCDRYRDDLQKIIVDGADVLPYQPKICGAGPVRKLNLWRDNPAAEWHLDGDPDSHAVQLYRQLIEFLCDGRQDYADTIYHWSAVSLYRMAERMRWALLCISHEKGTGKSLAFEILRRLHHEPHTASLESLSQLTGRFSGWLQAKTLCIVQETTDASQGRWGAMESLKSAISEEHMQVERKHADPQMTRHWTRFAFLGNSLESLPFDSNERRIFAVVCEATEPRPPEFYTAVAMQCMAQQGLCDIAAFLRPYADEPLPLRAPVSDVHKIQDSLVPPFVQMLNEAAEDRGDVALRGVDMNRIVRHLTGQSLRGGGQTEQLKRGGWRNIRTTIGGKNGRFWVRGDSPDSVDTSLADAVCDGGSVWI